MHNEEEGKVVIFRYDTFRILMHSYEERSSDIKLWQLNYLILSYNLISIVVARKSIAVISFFVNISCFNSAVAVLIFMDLYLD